MDFGFSEIVLISGPSSELNILGLIGGLQQNLGAVSRSLMMTDHPHKPEAFGTRLKRVRQERGWTQQQLAERSHQKRWSVVQWEMNTHFPLLFSAAELAKALDCSLDYLCGLTEE